MTEYEERELIINEAKTWLRTPYHHMAISKNIGTDCAMFIYGVFRNCSLIPILEIEPYSPQWHLNKTEEKYLNIVRRFAVETNELKPGNIVMYKFGRVFSHGGIIIEWPKIIHCVPKVGVIYDYGYDFSVSNHKVGEKLIFDFWGNK